MITIKYVGSKSRIAKHIVPIIQSYIDQIDASFYLEPFVGGANVIDKISCDKKIGYDINHYLIELLKHRNLIQELPDEITKDEYDAVRKSYQANDGKYPDWYIGAVGFLASYNGKFFGGRAGIVKTKIGTMRNYYDEAKRNLLSQLPRLNDVIFGESDYRLLDMSQYRHGVIYCDIPYKNTTGYQDSFNHDEFWQWAEECSKENIVLVSEQVAPDKWQSVWAKPVKRTLDNASRIDITEQLYIFSNNSLINTERTIL